MAITLNGTQGTTTPGLYSNSTFTGTFSDGIVVDYATGNGRISVGSADGLTIYNGGVASTALLSLDSSGNLGLGVTPSAWSLSGGNAFQSTAGAIASYGTGQFLSLANAYYNAGWKYMNSSLYATQYQQASGQHVWYTAPSGTAGNAITFTQAMTLDASGNLGIGTTSPGTKLHVYDGANDAEIKVQTAGTNKASYLTIVSTIAGYGGIQQLTNSTYEWKIDGGGSAGTMVFKTGSSQTERARIDSSGNLLVGTTSSSGKITAYQSASDGSSGLSVVKSSTTNTSAQWFISFLVNAGGTGSGYIGANGASQAAFGSFSDARLKENITALPSQLASICALKPSEFDYKDGSGHQIGFIAQEMQEVYPDVVGEGEDGMLTITGWSKTEARLVKAIQELTARLEALEAK